MSDFTCPICEEPIDHCPVCQEPPDYCQGHGEIGDPVGFAALRKYDEDLADGRLDHLFESGPHYD